MAQIGSNRRAQSEIQSEPDSIRVLDLKGMIAPLTFLKITQAFRQVKTGGIIEIIGNDVETRENLSKILGASSHELLDVQCKEDIYFIRLRKGGVQENR